MQTKLTLRLDDGLINSAKEFSRKTGKSVSQIVADYFAFLEERREAQGTKHITPVVQNLKGSMRVTNLSV